jgi:hypothetical protein
MPQKQSVSIRSNIWQSSDTAPSGAADASPTSTTFAREGTALTRIAARRGFSSGKTLQGILEPATAPRRESFRICTTDPLYKPGNVHDVYGGCIVRASPGIAGPRRKAGTWSQCLM